jgi:hypothetical protein
MSVIRIELLITIPDGATVALSAPQTAATPVLHSLPANDPNEPPFPGMDPVVTAAKQIFDKPPDAPVCPKGHGTMKLQPAGTSKRTGRNYPSFWSCPDRDCPEKRDAA